LCSDPGQKINTMSKPVKILMFKNEIEAMLLDEILTEKQIPHLIRSYHDSAYDGLWQTQSGWGHIEAPEEFAEEILSTYNQMSD
jgi:hypothetical protein